MLNRVDYTILNAVKTCSEESRCSTATAADVAYKTHLAREVDIPAILMRLVKEGYLRRWVRVNKRRSYIITVAGEEELFKVDLSQENA